MKRILVVFGVVAVFLFATFAAQAVENNTWGRIKATFSEDNPDLAAIQSDGAHLLDPTSETEDSEAPGLAKPAKTEEEEKDRATKKKGPARYANAPR